MNAYTIRILDMLERIVRFILDRPITPAIPRVTAAQAVVNTIITALQAAAQKQTTGGSDASGAVDVRVETARELRKQLRNVNRTGRVLDREHPGIAATFKLPKGGSYPVLLAAAEAIHLKATELEAEFIECGLPATFLADLAAAITAFRAATGEKHTGNALRSGSTAELKAKAQLGVDAATELDAYVRNHFRDNPDALGAWEQARHIERGPVRSPEPTDPPSDPGSGSSSGSGTSTTVSAD
jgi:hypothetical protein